MSSVRDTPTGVPPPSPSRHTLVCAGIASLPAALAAHLPAAPNATHLVIVRASGDSPEPVDHTAPVVDGLTGFASETDLTVDATDTASMRRTLSAVFMSGEVTVIRTAAAGALGSELDWLAAAAGVTVLLIRPGPTVAATTVPLRLDRTEALRLVDTVHDAIAYGPDFSSDNVPSDLVEQGRPSTLAKLLLRSALTAETLTAQPAGAQLLLRHGHEDLGRQLAELVEHWLGQRLWSLNLVPELVAHDDRHAERVDRLVAQLAGPLLAAGTLRPEEFFLLSAAAWLHDWGHVGAGLGWRWVEHPRDVRWLHGILSQQLLTKDYTNMHGMDVALAHQVGALAAHHQGWTSFGSTPAKQGAEHLAYREYVRHDPKTLHEDAEESGLDPERADLLVALLRVADGADVGVHRIPDLAARPHFLDFCVQRRALDTAERLTLRYGETAKDAVAAARLVAARPRSTLAQADLEAFPELQSLHQYALFVRDADAHYRKHARVLHVRITQSNPCVLHVIPSDPGGEPSDVTKALAAVRDDVESELSRPIGGHKTVRRVLADHNVYIDSEPRLDDYFEGLQSR